MAGLWVPLNVSQRHIEHLPVGHFLRRAKAAASCVEKIRPLHNSENVGHAMRALRRLRASGIEVVSGVFGSELRMRSGGDEQ
jgi:hypothetical protein